MYPPSPPSSTSLPEHFSFRPFSSLHNPQDPPPTDGPNTRARIARGLHPRSGTIAPLPSVGNEVFRGNYQTARTGESGEYRGLERWNRERSEENWQSAQIVEPSYEPYSTSLSFDQYASPMPTGPSTSSTIDPEPVFSFYPPEVSPCTTSPFVVSGSDPHRVFSNASIIDHGDEEEEDGQQTNDFSPSFPSDQNSYFAIESTTTSTSPELLRSSTTVAGELGITREEWLRLGGFVETEQREEEGGGQSQDLFRIESNDEENLFDRSLLPSTSSNLHRPPLSASTFDEPTFTPLSTISESFPVSAPPVPTVSYPLDSSSAVYTKTPLPYSPPTPIEPFDEFASLPDLGIPSLNSASTSPVDELVLPTPPPQFHTPQEHDIEVQAVVQQPASRSKARKAPSPIVAKRTRPQPYPTSSHASLPISSSSSSSTTKELVVPPMSPTALRNLTPVSHALASYKHFRVPSHPPPPSSPSFSQDPSEPPKKRKSHGRRTSIGHIPRPRNAFILFRSHAVSSGLIPKNIGVTDHKNISQIVGSVWRGLSDEERREWEGLAEEEKRVHREKYPDYQFKPRTRGTRAPAGFGKKALAKIRKEEEDREREERKARGETAADNREEGEEAMDEDERERSMSRSTARRMELIGQAVLEGDEEEKIDDRVRQELAQEGEVVVTSVKKTPRKAQVKVVKPRATPRRGRAASLSRSGDIPVVSPASSTSTIGNPSPSRTPTKRSSPTTSRGMSSPVSSPSPSPQRMQQHPYARSPPNSSSPSPSKHPLSRSHTSTDLDSPSNDNRRIGRNSHYAQAGLGLSQQFRPIPSVLLPPPSSSSSSSSSATSYGPPPPQPSFVGAKGPIDHIPLFTGGSDSRQFSLGRWELRKPSTSRQTLSEREKMAQCEEEEEAGEQARSTTTTHGLMDRSLSTTTPWNGRRIVSSLALDPREFLADTGLEEDGDQDEDDATGSAWETVTEAPSQYTSSSFSTADSSSRYAPSSSAPTTNSSRYSDPRQRQPGYRNASSASSSSTSTDPFHFGSVDLFSKPPPALLGRKPDLPRGQKSSTEEMPRSVDGDVGLGLRWGHETSSNR